MATKPKGNKNYTNGRASRWGNPVLRFASKVKWSLNKCLLWNGPINPVSGYASPFMGFGRTQAAHKWLYETLVGPVPKGFDLDHKCRVRHCVNPNHLEPVTRKENVRRGHGGRRFKAYQIVCKRGHTLDETNTYTRPSGERSCRECANSMKRKNRQNAK